MLHKQRSVLLKFVTPSWLLRHVLLRDPFEALLIFKLRNLRDFYMNLSPVAISTERLALEHAERRVEGAALRGNASKCYTLY